MMKQSYYASDLYRGNEHLFYIIFKKYYLQLYHFAATYLSDAEGPEDVVQEAFIKLWQKWLHFQQMNTVQSFLYITVRNQCLNICKHRKVVQKYNQYVLFINSGDKLESQVDENLDHTRKDTPGILDKTLQALPAACSRIMQMSFIEGLKNKEIARDLCISVNTVKTQKRRGVQALRIALS